MKAAILSDTHGLLRAQVLDQLEEAEHLIHAGDVGDPEILDVLREIAPLTVVRGNVDRGEWAQSLPQSEAVELEGFWIYVLHDLGRLDLDPAAAGFSVVISGHSHRPDVITRGGVLYLNPGSAGPRRFHLPISMAWLYLDGGQVRAELIDLEK